MAAGEAGGRPTGVLTFLFTDVEGSTRLWVADEASMAASLRVHDEVVRSVVQSHGGYVFSTAGDSFAVAFAEAGEAVACAVDVQEALPDVDWPGPSLRVRIGLHRGAAEERDGDYFGSVVSTAARVEAAAHGGQIVCTGRVRVRLERQDVVDLGVHHLRDVADPVPLFQIGDGDFPALRVVPPQLVRLPAPATPLVGQERVVRAVRGALLEQRLVTLTGVGGAGKTRLALEVGEEEIPHFPDGVVFVDLAAVPDPDDVPSAVLTAADVHMGPGETATDAVVRFVSAHRVLVILDNCEHVLDAAAELVEDALATRSDTRILATSREMLDVDGEQVVQVPSLDTTPDGAAVRLFVRRAAAVGAALDPADPVVQELCERLDGMPLAIELAAARTATMTPNELLSRLDDRFSLLARAGRRRRGHSRQRTLAATIDWSYALLTSEEQALLRACSVFDDTFDLDAAAAVADIDPVVGADLVAGLAAKSLLVARHTEVGSRYRLLETMRAYAEQKLLDHDETEPVRRRLIDHVAHTYVAPDDRILHEFRWGRTIETNHTTVTTAVEHAERLDLPVQTRVRLLTASLLRPPTVEAQFWSRSRVDLPDGADPDSPATRYALAIIGSRGRMHRGDFDGALECYDALRRAPDPWPWWAISNWLRIRHRHDPEAFERELPAAGAPHEAGVPGRVAIAFNVQSAPSIGGLNRDAGLAHLDELDRNPLVSHPTDEARFARFRSAIESAWAGPGSVVADPLTSTITGGNPFVPYQHPGRATTEMLAECHRRVRRDPSNHMVAMAALTALAIAAEARERPDIARRALVSFQWQPSWVVLAETAAPVIARRLGFLDEFTERDLDETEVAHLGQVFLRLAPELDSDIAGQN